MSTSGSNSRSRLLACAALTVACLLPFAPARADDGRTKGVIQWQSGASLTTAQSAGQIAQAVESARGVGGQRAVIQFERPLDNALRTSLELAGVKLLSYVGDNAFFARVDASRASGASVSAIPDIRCILPIQRNWKLHPNIVAQDYPDYSVVSRPKPGAAIGDQDPGATEVVAAAYVMFHPDVNLNDGMQLANRHGARITDVISPVNSIVIEIPVDNLAAFADESEIQWIEPPLPGFVELNNSNRARVGADAAQGPPYGLDGTGVTALVYDGGKVRNTHQDLAPRVTLGPNDASTNSDHSTHVAGTIGGTGAASAGLYKGMAPGVTFISFAFEMAGGLQQGFLYTFPGDIAQDYGWAIANGADIANNSIGTNTVPNGYPCEWEGNYGITDTLIDTIVRGTGTDPNYPQFNTPFRVVWANGNERQGTRCNDANVPAGYHLTAPPACAKNHITVGALNSNDDSMTTFSSWGPADDGRLKPDISAPGCQSDDDQDVTSCSSSSDTAYTGKCGTSMASPTTCGVGALIIQDFRQQFPGQPDMRNSTLKTILAHTAVDVFEPGPDYKSGYGSIRAVPAIELLRAGNFLENTISGTGALFTATVVANVGQPLKVTLAWDDVPGTPNVNPVLVNDLDLRVFDAQNNQYFPWTLAGLANPAAPAVRTQRNGLDNIEQVVIDNPAPGGYRIEVYGFNVPQGPQPFSLTATPLLVNCSSQGAASLDRPKFPCVSTAGARVIDCDLNTSDLVIDTVLVNVKSTTDPVGLDILLTEVAAEAATFTGSVGINTTGGPGVLQVSAGDTITLTYNDADNGNGQPAVVTATASIDCVGPVISDVAVAPINPRDATITFNTNESAKVTIRYGLECGALDETNIVAGYRTAHTVTLTGLQDNTPYFFAIDAEDEAGNQVTDNNGGACFTFATPEVPDFFTEDFSSAPANDLENLSLIWTPVGGVDFYSLCQEISLTQLPNDPNAGQTFASPFTDDSFRTINLTGGFTVSIYGVAYNTVHVGSNGYLTFVEGDSDYTETLADHFDTPRISALFDDLDPNQGGRITYQQLPDRLVVSFVNVPQHNVTGSANTFQFELFSDATIKLHVLTMSDTAGITGLSAGLGLSPDFFESDLTEYGGCSATFTLAAVPPAATICAPTTSIHTINVGVVEGFSDPVTLNIPNLPAGVNANFAPNPVIPGNSSTLTLTITNAAAPGTTNLQVHGVSGSINRNAYIGLTLYTAIPAAPALTAPADGATGVALNPTFTWAATPQAATYAIQVATDPAFSNIVGSANGLTATSWQIPSNLLDGTTYYWRTRATNTCGDGAWATAFSFSTLVVPDYFTQNFDTNDDNDLDDISLIWIPNGSVDFYSLCNEALAGPLPNDPNAGAALVYTASGQFRSITLTGASVLLYGTAYSTVHVGACGYLTFTAGDTDTTETLADHFDTPRISALFDSLSPQLAGAQVTWQQLSDKLVVSFVNVKELSTSLVANTFQYELFFNGEIRIHYKTIGAVDGIAGLSRGLGLPSPFFESNLNGYGACGPRPPIAVGQDGQTPVNVNLNIALEGLDDGLPDPPAALTYIITSLPSNGQLLDPGAGAIAAVPYTLVGGGNVVTYDPPFNFQGPVSFNFKVNDGGVPPEGGDSPSALVTIMVGGPQAIYTFPLDTDPGWSVENQWAFGVPAGQSGDPAAGYTGQNVYGFNLNGDYPNSMPQTYYLTSQALDFSSVSGVSLRFRRWLGVERSQYDFATIDVSNNNGASWTNVWTNPLPTGTSINETAWSYQTYDIAALADGHSQVRVRWGMGPTDTSVVYHGWNLDDIEFWAIVPLPPATGACCAANGACSVLTQAACLSAGGSYEGDETTCTPNPCAQPYCLGDVDCNGVVDFFDIDPFVARLGCPGAGDCGGACPWQNADIDEDGDVDFFDIDPFVGRLGSTCN